MTLAWRFGALALLLTGGAAGAHAQVVPTDTSQVVDRVVAVVGNRVVLASQVDQAVFLRFPQGRGLPTDPAQLRSLQREVLESIIEEELLVLEAERDTTIRVTVEQVQEAVDETYRNTRARFPSDAAFRQELRTTGFNTPEEYRAWLVDEQRRSLLIQAVESARTQQGRIKPVSPTEAEMRALFERERGGFPPRPALVSLRQIVIAPQPTDAAKAVTRQLGDSIVAELRKGADFAMAARRFSQDPGSRELGGSLDWFRRGQMVAEFERVAFSLRPGFISDPVESPFGYHIIQVERVQPAEVKARHILLQPSIGPERADSARALAERVHAAVRAGASLDSLQRRYHDRSMEPELRQIPEPNLPAGYLQSLEGVASGALAPLVVLSEDDATRTRYAVVEVIARAPAGEPRYEDVVEEIRRALARRIGIRRFIDGLRAATHVEVRDP